MKQPWIIVPAAGIGSRMQADKPKQYLTVLNKPVLAHTLIRLMQAFPGAPCIVPLAAGDPWWPALPNLLPSPVITCLGGADRAASVLSGLMTAKAQGAQPEDWMLVHDAVRPCVPIVDLENLWSRVIKRNTCALLGAPVVDSLRRVDSEQQITGAVDRSGLWRVFTPQVFQWGDLHEALIKAQEKGVAVTDESEAVLQLGRSVETVLGSELNIKLTYPDDITRAEQILQKQGVQA